MGLTAKRRRKAVLLIKWIHQCGVFLLVFVACLEPARSAPEFKAYKLIKIYDKIANSDIHHLKSNDSKQWHHKVESLNSDWVAIHDRFKHKSVEDTRWIPKQPRERVNARDTSLITMTVLHLALIHHADSDAKHAFIDETNSQPLNEALIGIRKSRLFINTFPRKLRILEHEWLNRLFASKWLDLLLRYLATLEATFHIQSDDSMETSVNKNFLIYARNNIEF